MKRHTPALLLQRLFLVLFVIMATLLVGYAIYHPCQRLWPLKSFTLVILILIILGTLGLLTYYLHHWSAIHLHLLSLFNLGLIVILACLALYYFKAQPHWDAIICSNTAYHLYPQFNWHDVTAYEHNYALNDYPNNLGLIYFEACFFKLLAFLNIHFSITQAYYYLPPLNIFLLISSLWLAYRLLQRHCHAYVAALFTVLSLLMSAFFPAVTIFYTDYPAMLVIMLMLTCYDQLLTTHAWRYLLLLGLITIIGVIIKFNIFIVLIGITIHYALTHNWRQWLGKLMLLWLSLIILIPVTNTALRLSTGTPAAKYGMPVIHWPLMSLNASGGYTDAGEAYTERLKARYPKQTVAKIETKQYIDIWKHQPQRVWRALQAKVSWVYSEGTYQSLKYCLVSPLHQPRGLLKYCYGSQRGYFIYWCSAFNLVVWLIVLGGVWYRLFQRHLTITFWDVALISVFGNMLFLLFWEANSRYMFAFLPMLLMLASVSLGSFFLKKKT